jgi:hypothetical protein
VRQSGDEQKKEAKIGDDVVERCGGCVSLGDLLCCRLPRRPGQARISRHRREGNVMSDLFPSLILLVWEPCTSCRSLQRRISGPPLIPSRRPQSDREIQPRDLSRDISPVSRAIGWASSSELPPAGDKQRAIFSLYAHDLDLPLDRALRQLSSLLSPAHRQLCPAWTTRSCRPSSPPSSAW